MERKFKISESLKSNIRYLLARQEIPFRIKNEEETLYLYCGLSGMKFHHVVQRAKCMKLTEETGILHITKRESENDELVMSLLRENNTHCYVITGDEQK